LPERWLPDSPHFRPVDPNLVLPFGKGPRACIGKQETGRKRKG
jgi:cytochrome P450